MVDDSFAKDLILPSKQNSMYMKLCPLDLHKSTSKTTGILGRVVGRKRQKWDSFPRNMPFKA